MRLAVSILEVILPILLVILAIRRLGVQLKYVVLGMSTFLVSEMILRLPLLTLAGRLLGNGTQGSLLVQSFLLGLSLLTTGLFEETARFLGYRWFAENTAKTWLLGIACGIGHGGCESFGLGIAGIFSAFSNAASAQSPLLSLADASVRLWAICLQVALSLMVLRVFQRRQIRWLWIAVTVHVLINLTGALVPHDGAAGRLGNALVVSFLGVLGLWYVLHSRMVEIQTKIEPKLSTTQY